MDLKKCLLRFIKIFKNWEIILLQLPSVKLLQLKVDKNEKFVLEFAFYILPLNFCLKPSAFSNFPSLLKRWTKILYTNITVYVLLIFRMV